MKNEARLGKGDLLSKTLQHNRTDKKTPSKVEKHEWLT